MKPRSLPRPLSGANSPTSASEVGHVGADREADDDGAGEEHRRVHREGDQSDADRINEQVLLVDALAAEFVAEAPPKNAPTAQPIALGPIAASLPTAGCR